MTNEKVIKMYTDFLVEIVGCNADSFGNRPCDYGRPCERCMSEYYQNIWKNQFNKALEKEAGF